MALNSYVYPFNVGMLGSTYTSGHPLISYPDFGDVWIDKVEIKIPSGHRGLTGIYLANSGGILVPYSRGNPVWLIGDDDLLEYDIGAEFDTGFQVVTYNQDVITHDFYLRFTGVPMSLYQQTTTSMTTIVPVTA